MGGCPFPEHHQGGHGGNGLTWLVVLVLIVAAAAGPVIQAVTDLLEIALMVAAGLLVTSAAVGVLVWRHRRRARLQLWRPALRIVPGRVEPIGDRARPAIEAPRPGTGTQARRHTPAHVVTRPGTGQQCNRRTGRRS